MWRSWWAILVLAVLLHDPLQHSTVSICHFVWFTCSWLCYCCSLTFSFYNGFTYSQWRPEIKSLSVLHFGYHHHHSILPEGRSFPVNSETKTAVLLKGRSSTANSGTQVAVLLGVDRCGSFLLLSAPHSLFSIWTDLKWSEKIPGDLEYIPP